MLQIIIIIKKLLQNSKKKCIEKSAKYPKISGIIARVRVRVRADFLPEPESSGPDPALLILTLCLNTVFNLALILSSSLMLGLIQLVSATSE